MFLFSYYVCFCVVFALPFFKSIGPLAPEFDFLHLLFKLLTWCTLLLLAFGLVAPECCCFTGLEVLGHALEYGYLLPLLTKTLPR